MRVTERAGIGSLVLALAAGLLIAAPAAPAAVAEPGPGSPSMDDPYFPEYGNGGYDVLHYDIRDTVRPGAGRRAGLLSGRTVLTARAEQALSSFHLDFVLPVRSVEVDGRAARFGKPDRHELRITPAEPIEAGESFRVVVSYAGRPARYRWRGERVWVGDRHEVVTMGEPQMAAWWFPANDHPLDKATFDIRIRVPRGKQVVANGRLVDRRDVGDRWTVWHWRPRDPMATYLAFFAAGDLRIERGRTRAGQHYVHAASERLGPRRTGRAMRFLRRTPKVLRWLERRLGEHPFETTGGMVTSLDPGFALETQTRPTYPYVGAGRGWLVAHELAHQWFGNRVSLTRWQDIWLNEGPATWFHLKWVVRSGPDTMQDWLAGTWVSLPRDDKFWKVPIGDPGPNRIFHQAVYYRGAMTLQALRNRIGEEHFRTLLRRWVSERDHGTTEDFRDLAESVSGQDLDGFFDVWLFRTRRPARTAENGWPGRPRDRAPAAGVVGSETCGAGVVPRGSRSTHAPAVTCATTPGR